MNEKTTKENPKFWVRCPDCDDQWRATVIDLHTEECCTTRPVLMHDDHCEISLSDDSYACTCSIANSVEETFIDRLEQQEARLKPLAGIDDVPGWMKEVKDELWKLGAMLYQRQFSQGDEELVDDFKFMYAKLKGIEALFPKPTEDKEK